MHVGRDAVHGAAGRGAMDGRVICFRWLLDAAVLRLMAAAAAAASVVHLCSARSSPAHTGCSANFLTLPPHNMTLQAPGPGWQCGGRVQCRERRRPTQLYGQGEWLSQGKAACVAAPAICGPCFPTWTAEGWLLPNSQRLDVGPTCPLLYPAWHYPACSGATAPRCLE